jgi:hypothetical protein
LKVSPFSYFWYRIRFPKLKVFLDEGYGIEARYKKGGWEDHLAKSKLFIADSLLRIGRVKSILVLGAGRLYDCDLDVLSEFCEEILLLDADPRAVSSWPKRAGKAKVLPICKDATGVFESWRERVKKGSSDFPSPEVSPFPEADLIISLNLKSQLSVLFREYIQGSKLDLETRLQADHCESVLKQSRKASIFLYDRSYKYLRDGVVIESESLDLSPLKVDDSWNEILKRDWSWNLEEGRIIHDVVGRAFLRM